MSHPEQTGGTNIMSKTETENISTNNDRKRKPAISEIENTGNYLRTLRLGMGLSIKDVTEATRISEKNLNAIEDENFSALPASTFTRGLLNIYAKFLGADSEAVVAKFMEERGDSSSQIRRFKQQQSRDILAPKRLAEPSQISSITMAGILFLVIVVSFTGYCVYTSWNPLSFLMKGNGNIQSVLQSVFSEGNTAQNSHAPGKISGEEITPSQLTEEGAEVSSTFPTETTVASEDLSIEQKTEILPSNYTITLHFLKNTSIELTRDGGETIKEEYNSGEIKSWSADTSLTMTFSQPDSAEIIVNNAAVAFPKPQDGIYSLQIPPDKAELQPDE